MLIPNFFGEDFLDTFFDDFTRPVRSAAKGHGLANMPQVLPQVPVPSMRTDIKEKEDGYDFDIDLPGYDKADITAELKDGYMTVTAKKEKSSEETDEKTNYIRRERYFGTVRRSFYVGEQIKQEDIKAKFENGILNLFVPKIDEKPEEEVKNFINID